MRMTTLFEAIAGDIGGVWAHLRGLLLVNTCSERLLAELDQLREDKADLVGKNKHLRAENTALRTLNLELRAVAFVSAKTGLAE
jgi:regulator of replication initiation timing